MNFYSHVQPDKLLIEHLREVKEYIQTSEEGLSGRLDETNMQALLTIALCHDFGKFTTYFQKHLLEGVKGTQTQHGFISAIFGTFAWKMAHPIKVLPQYFSFSSIIPLLMYSVILHHHGNINTIEKNLPRMPRGDFEADNQLLEKIDVAYLQIDDMKSNYDIIYNQLNEVSLGKAFESFVSQPKGFIEKLLQDLKAIELLFKYKFNQKGIDTYFLHQIFYSYLVWADKLSAANLQNISHRCAEYKHLISFRKGAIKSSGNDFVLKTRQLVFETVMKNIEKYCNNKIFSLTTPTGTGKTLAGFYAALKLKELSNLRGKIIYALPFTSIIDQNYEVIYSIFKNLKDFEGDKDRFLLKHHHLANIEYKSSEQVLKNQPEDEDYSPDKLASEMLIESWASGFIVTTFVQLLETLISNKNRMLKKFHSFKDSVIILDEIQAIDVEFLKLVEEVLKKACDILNCKIILMTATKPMIFEDAIELSANIDVCVFNRTRLIPINEDMRVSEFVDYFVENIFDSQKSFLIVANTIRQSLLIFNGLKNRIKDRKIIYLSAALVPAHRRERIDEINRILSSKKPIVVSTQVVEAGVDLDFDAVVRDIAPVDSIIQCAGRCNRHGQKKQGDVFVVRIKDEDKGYFSTRVYGSTTINIAKNLLEGVQNEIEEKDYRDLIERYYKLVKENKSAKKSDDYLQALKILNFKSTIEKDISIDNFSLIQQRGGYMSVIIRLDDRIEEAYQKYLSSFRQKDYYKRREIYLDVKNVLFDYTISIPMKYVKEICEENMGIFSLPKDSVQRYYKEDTGFVYDGVEDFIIV